MYCCYRDTATITSLVCIKQYTSATNKNSEQLFESSGIKKPKPCCLFNTLKKCLTNGANYFLV